MASNTSSATGNRRRNDVYDRFSVVLRKGEKKTLDSIAGENSLSRNALIITALNDWLNGHGYGSLKNTEKKLKASVLEALEEARRIAYDENEKGYTSEELFALWEEEDNEV